ncbi:MAG TPA: cobyric acid synthase [Euzebyales bacterium]|nr:cobyric acid synthase [Euzebyales bacterium]
MTGQAVMVQGTSSSAGKSLLTTALCAHAARAGIRVAPFKAQNMSNNPRVVDGGEIGTAQALQALACGIAPDVRMNPVLVKPEADTRSQVVRRGRVDHELSGLRWEERTAALWGDIRDSLHDLLDSYDLVVLEGAGSPAEFNHWPYDLANMRVAEEADAPVLVVSDVDRGGALAHCYGTWAVPPADQRARIRAFVLNRFRGDLALLRPGLDGLRARTGVPVAGVLPWMDHGLPDEDAAGRWGTRWSDGQLVEPIAVVAYPTISNLDEFSMLARAVPVVWARRTAQLAGARLIVLPGAKHIASSIDWLRASGLADAISTAVRSGTPVVGICGGMQLLGDRLEDPYGVDGVRDGLGLLPLRTTFAAEKLTASWHGTFTTLPGPWRPWSGLPVSGYEIRHGVTTATGAVDTILRDGRGFARDGVLGVSVHGLFEDPRLFEALLDVPAPPGLDDVFAGLAEAVTTHLDPTIIDILLTEVTP